MCASVVSIIINLMLGNGFGGELDLKTFDLIFLKAKCVIMIFITMIFRCSSLVMMATMLRWYSIIPILLIGWISHNTTQYVFHQNSFFFNLCQKTKYSLFGSLSDVLKRAGFILVGPRLNPIERFLWFHETFSNEEKKEHDMKRKKLWLIDSIISFVFHSIILIIIIVLWEKTSLFDQNLSVCTFPIIEKNISMICGIIMGVGLLSCLMPFLYYKY